MRADAIPLPVADIVNEYRRGGISWRQLGERYGCSWSTVNLRCRAYCAEHGLDWPLVPHTQRRGQNRDTVSADLARREIAQTCKQFRITQGKLAALAGLRANHLHQISSGHKQRIERKTQGKILEACSKLYAGEVVFEPMAVILPMQVRDVCPNNHRYTGARDSQGRRKCNLCRAYKDQRRDAKVRTIAS